MVEMSFGSEGQNKNAVGLEALAALIAGEALRNVTGEPETKSIIPRSGDLSSIL
jgi:hypothetical protein